MNLTKAMKNQLLAYLDDIEDGGVYWGNKKQFWDRHKKIIEWLLEQKTSK